MKYLVGTDNYVKSSGEAPLGFSVSGKIVVDVPSDLEVVGLDGTLGNLLTTKNNAILAQHPSMAGLFYDELMSASGVDVSLSTRFMTGVRKRTCMLPGGKLVFTAQALPSSITACFFHCSLFNLVHEAQPVAGDRPGPSRLLYQEVAVSSSTVTVELLDSAGTSVLLGVVPDSEQALILPSSTSVRVSVENLTTDILYLGDWILLYG